MHVRTLLKLTNYLLETRFLFQFTFGLVHCFRANLAGKSALVFENTYVMHPIEAKCCR